MLADDDDDDCDYGDGGNDSMGNSLDKADITSSKSK
jgi:hypothetical protein